MVWYGMLVGLEEDGGEGDDLPNGVHCIGHTTCGQVHGRSAGR